MNKNLISKLTSRKFIVTAISAIAGIITMIVGDNAIVQTITGAAMTIVPIVVYCIMEGVIDSASVKTITEATAEAAEKLGADETVIDAIEKAGEITEILVDNENSEE